jgi:hypothetical protein
MASHSTPYVKTFYGIAVDIEQIKSMIPCPEKEYEEDFYGSLDLHNYLKLTDKIEIKKVDFEHTNTESITYEYVIGVVTNTCTFAKMGCNKISIDQYHIDLFNQFVGENPLLKDIKAGIYTYVDLCK